MELFFMSEKGSSSFLYEYFIPFLCVFLVFISLRVLIQK